MWQQLFVWPLSLAEEGEECADVSYSLQKKLAVKMNRMQIWPEHQLLVHLVPILMFPYAKLFFYDLRSLLRKGDETASEVLWKKTGPTDDRGPGMMTGVQPAIIGHKMYCI